ncbi:MAG: hypothetical protein H0U70_10475 [Tatlockia sp.]|nr:hypothetical protein [Tatlockia sp.]
MSKFGRSVGRLFATINEGLKTAQKEIKNHLLRHWKLYSALLISTVVLAILIPVIIFAWPAAVTGVAGMFAAMPWWLGGPTVATWMIGLMATNLPAAAAFVSALAFGASLAACGMFNLCTYLSNKMNFSATRDLPENRKVGNFEEIGAIADANSDIVTPLYAFKALKKPTLDQSRVSNSTDVPNIKKLFQTNDFEPLENSDDEILLNGTTPHY